MKRPDYCTKLPLCIHHISDIQLKLFVDQVFITTDLGSRVEVSCVLDCNCLDFDITPVWTRDTEDNVSQASVGVITV